VINIANMKNLRILILLSLITASFNFIKCSKGNNNEMHPVDLINPDTVSFYHSMKGWEFYSWPNGDDWNYSILEGTNRTKSYNEVTTNKIVVCGKDSLKMLLDKFPENEYIFWIGKKWLESCWGSDYGNLSLPDNKTINEIKEYCAGKKLVLGISD
jgi:hypothetical protein